VAKKRGNFYSADAAGGCPSDAAEVPSSVTTGPFRFAAGAPSRFSFQPINSTPTMTSTVPIMPADSIKEGMTVAGISQRERPKLNPADPLTEQHGIDQHGLSSAHCLPFDYPTRLSADRKATRITSLMPAGSARQHAWNEKRA